MTTQLQIAQTIAQQIGGRRLMALGAKNRLALSESADKRGGLQFTASLFGRRSCRVIVELTHSDTYRVLVLKPRAYVVIAKLDDVYCEDLGNLVEFQVEKHFSGH